MTSFFRKTLMAIAMSGALAAPATASVLNLPEIAPLPEAASTGPVTHIDFKLKGSIFGIKVIDILYDGQFSADAYSLRADLSTAGLGRLVKKMNIWATTTGTYDAQGLYPIKHIQQNRDKKNRRIELAYDTSKVDVSVVPRFGSLGEPPATNAEIFSSDDSLSTILNMMMRGYRYTEQPCQGKIKVFDGKQHYNLRLEQKNSAEKFIRQKGYKGSTIACNVYYEAISGYDPEDLPTSEEEATPLTVYFGQFHEHKLWVPVRFVYKVSGFSAVVKATDIAIKTTP